MSIILPEKARAGLHLVPDWSPGPGLVPERPPGPGLSDFAVWLRANGCRDRTIEERLSHVADFARHHPSFPAVQPMHVTTWLGRDGLAHWSRATYYGHLRSYFTFAMEHDLLSFDPMARMRRPRVPKGKPRPLTGEEVDVVLSAATNANLRAWLTLALFAGLRVHEIVKMRGEDVTPETIFVIGKGGTSAEVPTHPLVWALAQTRPKDGWWFPTSSACGHVTSKCASTLITKLFAANGIEGSIHRARHTFATDLLRGGANIRVVQELMRHASLDSTMIYTDVLEAEKVEAIRGLVPKR